MQDYGGNHIFDIRLFYVATPLEKRILAKLWRKHQRLEKAIHFPHRDKQIRFHSNHVKTTLRNSFLIPPLPLPPKTEDHWPEVELFATAAWKDKTEAPYSLPFLALYNVRGGLAIKNQAGDLTKKRVLPIPPIQGFLFSVAKKGREKGGCINILLLWPLLGAGRSSMAEMGNTSSKTKGGGGKMSPS